MPLCLNTVGAALWNSVAVVWQVWSQAPSFRLCHTACVRRSQALTAQTNTPITCGNMWWHIEWCSDWLCVFGDDSRLTVWCAVSSAITARGRNACSVCWEHVCVCERVSWHWGRWRHWSNAFLRYFWCNCHPFWFHVDAVVGDSRVFFSRGLMLLNGELAPPSTFIYWNLVPFAVFLEIHLQ